MSIKQMLKSVNVKCVKNDQYMVSVCETIDNGIHQGVLMVTPRHPFMLQCIEKIVDNVESEYYGESPWDITGPTCFYQSVCDVLRKNGCEVSANQRNFKLGVNVYNDLSFYLFKFTKPMQYVKSIKDEDNNKRERVLLKKKFSQLQHIYRKHLHEDTYSDMWKKRNIYHIDCQNKQNNVSIQSNMND